jgi:tRNA 2-thiouridine synthesizing protein A
VLDARGLRCPLPVLRARERLAGLRPGTVLELLADDPLVTLDVPAFCAREGHEVLATREDPPGVWTLTIRRGD